MDNLYCLEDNTEGNSGVYVVTWDKESGIGVIRGLTELIFFDINRCKCERP
jgi:hypothetical protein